MVRSQNDMYVLFLTRITRLFAYGFLSVTLVLYLAKIGLTEKEVGLLFTLALIGDAAISLWITTTADRFGRKRMLILGGLLIAATGITFTFAGSLLVLFAAAIFGVISPSGNEIGPFLSIEQAVLTQIVSDKRRTKVFAWYNLAGSLSTAVGALCGGVLPQILQRSGVEPLESYRAVVILYTLLGVLLAAFFTQLSASAEATASANSVSPGYPLGLHRSRRTVMRLSGLFALDAFAGGFIVQSILAYWFHIKFGVEPAALGAIFFGANLLAGLSALSAARIAKKIGLMNTMVFTHIPSNILLILVPLMPNLSLSILILLLRFSISQMDVPTRQSYTMAVVSPDERSAASGITSIARSVGASLSPALSGQMLAGAALMSFPFFFSGVLKIIYDLLLYRSFRSLKPPEEVLS